MRRPAVVPRSPPPTVTSHRTSMGLIGSDSGLSHSETGCAAFAGAGASSASATCLFRESISHPVRPLSTLRTPRCRDARKTRSRPACSALGGPDLHWQAHIGFSYRTPHPALGQDVTPLPTARCTLARSGVRDRNARRGARVDTSRPVSPDLVLVAQPPAQPHGCVVVEHPIRFS